jgi:hypothetical protein
MLRKGAVSAMGKKTSQCVRAYSSMKLNSVSARVVADLGSKGKSGNDVFDFFSRSRSRLVEVLHRELKGQ